MQAARAGSWIVISTVKFPQFWKRLCDQLEQAESAGDVQDSFRLFFDLQGLSQNDISEAFLFDHSIPFHLTEQNAEEFESLEDVWSTILDERILIKLEEKIETMRQMIIDEQKPKSVQGESASEAPSSQRASQTGRTKDLVPADAPSNFKLSDETIKSEAQRKLYKQLMRDARARNKVHQPAEIEINNTPQKNAEIDITDMNF